MREDLLKESPGLLPHPRREAHHSLKVIGVPQESSRVATTSNGSLLDPDVGVDSTLAGASLLNSSSRSAYGTTSGAAQTNSLSVSQRATASNTTLGADEAAKNRRIHRNHGRIKSCTQCRQQKVNICLVSVF